MPRGAGRPVLLALAIFWGVALLVLGGAAGALQYLATRQAAGHAVAPAPPAPAPAPSAHLPAAPVPAAPPVAPAPSRPLAPGAAIPGPDPAMLEASVNFPGVYLPRIAPDGRMPMRAYAAGRDPAETRPRIALLLADFAMNEQDSDEAVRSLPPAVSFAVSPYAPRTLERLLGAARARGHETLAALPLEPQNFPIDNAGAFSLLTGYAPAVNAQRLEWALSRFGGYAGATAALGRLHGERYAAAPELFAALLEEVARRGLLYIDPRPGAAVPNRPGMPPFRAVDVVVDTPPIRSEIEAKLGRLEQIARARGTALGLASGPLPMTTDRIAAWAVSLPARGFALVPVSALALPPMDTH